MSKRAALGAALAVSLLVVLGAAIYVTSWDEATNDSPEPIPYDNVVTEDSEGNDVVDMNSLNGALFETYGPVLLVLGILMFGAMIGGVCIAREEVEKDDSA